MERRRLVIVVLAVTALVALAGCAGALGDGAVGSNDTADAPLEYGTSTGSQPAGESSNGTLSVHFIDVGQGASVLVEGPTGETMLVDSGDWTADGEAVLAYLEARGVDRLDYLVTTHADADHIGGHAAVIEHFETEGDGIGAAYDPGVAHDTATYERYLDAVEGHGVDLLLVEEGDRLPLADDNASALVLNPPAGEAEGDFHDNSVALAVEFGGFTYLTTGDAERGTEQRLLAEWPAAVDADVYQAGHHGSSSSSTAAFVDAVDPRLAVISSDRDSQFGHPHDEVLATFANRDIETYWTGVHGDVVVTTDGDDIDVTTAEQFPADPDEMVDAKGSSSSLAPVAAATGPRTPGAHARPGTHVARARTPG